MTLFFSFCFRTLIQLFASIFTLILLLTFGNCLYRESTKYVGSRIGREDKSRNQEPTDLFSSLRTTTTSPYEYVGKRIDWVGQTHHPQPQDQFPSIRTSTPKMLRNNRVSAFDNGYNQQQIVQPKFISEINDDVQQRQQQISPSVSGTLNEFLQRRS